MKISKTVVVNCFQNCNFSARKQDVGKCEETGKNTWAFQYFDRDLNLIATDSGINITNHNKCVELAIMFATKFLVR